MFFLLRSVLFSMVMILPLYVGATTIDFTNAPVNDTGYGNTISISQEEFTVSASAWGATGHEGIFSWLGIGTPILESAEIISTSSGLGVCDREEGTLSGAGWFSPKCNYSSEQALDHKGKANLIMFQFDQDVTFNSVVLDPLNSSDTDISFAVISTSASLDLSGLELFEGFNRIDKMGSFSSLNTAVSLDGLSGNTLLLSAKEWDDYYSVASLDITSVASVPLPASLWLFAFGILGLVTIRRKSED